MIPKLYRGFSTSNFLKHRTFAVYDVELVKQDIINHIYTRVGERVMLPTFGTSIPDMVFEQFDQSTIGIIREDILRVINYDPRVRLQQLTVQPNFDNQILNVSARVQYVELNLTGTIDLNIEFDAFWSWKLYALPTNKYKIT